MPHGSFFEITAILGLATLLGIVGQKLRQPLIIMFLAAGILAGPPFLGIIRSYDQIELLAQIGISLLLFIVGLKLDLNLIRTTGPVALATGLGQIVFTGAIGFAIAWGLGMAPISAAYVAVALTFSSTIIIVKLLSDKKEIDSLHGRIAVGFLIVQDIAAILALVALTTFGSRWRRAKIDPVDLGGRSPSRAWALLAVVGLLMRYRAAAADAAVWPSSQEMLLLFAIAWAVLPGRPSASCWASARRSARSWRGCRWPPRPVPRLRSARAWRACGIFCCCSSSSTWGRGWIGPPWGRRSGRRRCCRCSCWSAIPLIVLLIMGFMGYRRRTGFLAGLTVAQISEFSLIVAALGVTLGHITPQTMGLITLVGVVTIFASTYMILYSQTSTGFSPAR